MSMYGKYKDKKGPLKVEEWPIVDCKGDPGFTVQADADEADINVLVARYNKSGQLPPMRGGQPFYGDVSDIGDLQESLIKVQEGNRLFMSYPADLRERFDNDPAKLIAFLSDDNNLKEAEELGLVAKRPIVEPAASAVPPAGAPATGSNAQLPS